MPIIDGKRVKARFTSLKLDELSSVDRPAQAGAKAVILKRHDGDLQKGETTMPTIEELQAANAELTAKLAKAESDMAAMQEAMDEKDDECEKTKKALAAATDESVSVGGEVFKRSEVGDVSFRAMKAMAAERDRATFEKRADAEFRHVVGTTTQKALVLEAVEKMGGEAKDAMLAIMSAAEKMAAAGFNSIGTSYPGVQPTAKAARATFDEKVAEIAKRDGISQTAAMQKARREFPDDFANAYSN